MTKHLKLTIKNAQIAEAVNLGSIKDKLKKKGSSPETEEKVVPKKEAAVSTPKRAQKKEAPEVEHEVEEQAKIKEEPPRKARSKSAFSEGLKPTLAHVEEEKEPVVESKIEEIEPLEEIVKPTSAEELRKKIFAEELEPQEKSEKQAPAQIHEPQEVAKAVPAPVQEPKVEKVEPKEKVFHTPPPAKKEYHEPFKSKPAAPYQPPPRPEYVKLGPTGRHIKDLLPPVKPKEQAPPASTERAASAEDQAKARTKVKARTEGETVSQREDDHKKGGPKAPVKEFRDLKPLKKQETGGRFDTRDRQGLRDTEDEQRWRKKRYGKQSKQEEIPVVRPTHLKIRTPISIKDLASEMKLKSSQLISKLFMQGIIITLNDLLDDETTILLLGQEFGCEITIDTSEEQRIRITDKTVKEEIQNTDQDRLIIRPPVVAFMGHVDHGKTSLIDAIRKSNRVAGEAGAITQHIGAFRCHTAVGDIAILDTPGHEAFSAMRARGADVTDIVVLVVAGDEGIRQQTIEAIQHAKAAKVTIVVALNKSDKPGFNPETIYRQLSENELLPEVWGGQTLTVNCSAVTGEGINTLLETLALQAEIMELRCNPTMRARGTVLESEMHKGLGSVATVLVQNGTLRPGDALVFENMWGRVKTMRDDLGRDIAEAPPSTPVLITGLSGLPDAGEEFIVVKNEREAREIADERRMLGIRQTSGQPKKKLTIENLLQEATPTTKKILNIVLRADVQGSLEALKVALEKIKSDKAEVNIVSFGVGEVSESDIQLAATSKGVVIGFHTKIESHAEQLIKQLGVTVKLHDIIYHAVDDVKLLMTALLDKIAQENERGKAFVQALFKSSQAGIIAGCMVTEGAIQRNHHIRIMREGVEVAKTTVLSLRRGKEDAREVTKGMECGIVLNKFTDVKEGDVLEAYDITYITQEL